MPSVLSYGEGPYYCYGLDNSQPNISFESLTYPRGYCAVGDFSVDDSNRIQTHNGAKIATTLRSFSEINLSNLSEMSFIESYINLSYFLDDGEIGIDNNLSERALRNPVLGRKNFYGNHSKKGAETASILYSIMESCKMSGLNPKKYLEDIIKDIHNKREVLTPWKYKERLQKV